MFLGAFASINVLPFHDPICLVGSCIGLPVTNDGQNMSNQSSMATVFKNLTHCDSICSINYLRGNLIKTNYINTYHQSSDASFALSTSQRATKSLSSERTSSRAA